MILFLDASALVAVLAREPEAPPFDDLIQQADRRLTSPIAVWEATRGLANARTIDFAEARTMVAEYLALFEVELIEIGTAEGELALDAHWRYGKGRHRASLNMGDCFAYACAKTQADALLFKGEDFIHTDVRDATLP